METKQQIRAVLAERRNHLPESRVMEYSRRICEKLTEIPGFKESSVIYFYYPLGKEVNLLPLAQQMLDQGKCIAFPKTFQEFIEFYPAVSLSEFRKGTFGIMEPLGEASLREQNPLVLVPGVGFDLSGNRIGYGKGYYDRYFGRFSGCRKIGIAYECQITEKIPSDGYDVPMELVITERNERHTGGNL